MEYPQGMFSWADVAVPDVEKGKAFYSDLFGWTAEDTEGYVLFRKDGKLVAGLGGLQGDGQPSVWTSYVNVGDADAIAAKARELGGAVLMDPMDVMTAGRMAVVADPAGAVIAFWQAKDHAGAELYNEPGSLTWNELATRDVGAAKRFYAELLPWEISEERFDGFVYNTILLGGRPNGGIFAMPDEVPDEVPSHWIAYLRVDHTDAAVEKLKGLGGTAMGEPNDSPFGKVARVQDPFGAAFSIIGPAPEAA